MSNCGTDSISRRRCCQPLVKISPSVPGVCICTTVIRLQVTQLCTVFPISLRCMPWLSLHNRSNRKLYGWACIVFRPLLVIHNPCGRNRGGKPCVPRRPSGTRLWHARVKRGREGRRPGTQPAITWSCEYIHFLHKQMYSIIYLIEVFPKLTKVEQFIHTTSSRYFISSVFLCINNNKNNMAKINPTLPREALDYMTAYSNRVDKTG